MSACAWGSASVLTRIPRPEVMGGAATSTDGLGELQRMEDGAGPAAPSARGQRRPVTARRRDTRLPRVPPQPGPAHAPARSGSASSPPSGRAGPQVLGKHAGHYVTRRGMRGACPSEPGRCPEPARPVNTSCPACLVLPPLPCPPVATTARSAGSGLPAQGRLLRSPSRQAALLCIVSPGP